MESRIDYIKYSEFPEYLVQDIAFRLGSFSTAIILIDSRGPHLIGSGTFIRVGQHRGVLTADHVTDIIPESAQLGFTLTTAEHYYAVDGTQIRPVTIARGDDAELGPDLSFIILSDSVADTVEAYKVFYSIEKRRDKLLSEKPDDEDYPLFLFGFPQECMKIENPETGFPVVLNFWGYAFATSVHERKSIGGHDLIDVGVDYSQQSDTQQDFSGISGGGLWKITSFKNEQGKLSPTEFILSGVTFYQTEIRDRFRTIRCNGTRTIYEGLNQETISS